jgi:hypothetical protein
MVCQLISLLQSGMSARVSSLGMERIKLSGLVCLQAANVNCNQGPKRHVTSAKSGRLGFLIGLQDIRSVSSSDWWITGRFEILSVSSPSQRQPVRRDTRDAGSLLTLLWLLIVLRLMRTTVGPWTTKSLWRPPWQHPRLSKMTSWLRLSHVSGPVLPFSLGNHVSACRVTHVQGLSYIE